MTSAPEGVPATVPCEHCGTLLEAPRYDNVPPWIEAAENGTYHSDSRCRDVLKERLATAVASEKDAVQHAAEPLALLQCVVMARPTRRLNLHLQQSGRCVRPWGVQSRKAIVPFIQGLFQRAKDAEASENALDVSLATMEKERNEALKSLQFLLSAEVCGSCGEETCTFDSAGSTIRCASCGADRMLCSKCTASLAEKERTLSALRALATAVLNNLSEGGQNGFRLATASRERDACREPLRGESSIRRGELIDALLLAADVTGPLTS